MPLTDVAIRNAKPRPKPYKLGDSLGLFLLVQPAGGKLWRLKYRVDGKEKKLSIGSYPEVGLERASMPRPSPFTLAYGSFDQFVEQQILPGIESGALAADDMVDVVAALRSWEADGTWERAFQT